MLHLNICFRHLTLPTILYAGSVELIISTFVCAKLHGQFTQYPGLAMFPLVAVNTFVTIFVITSIAARVNTGSNDLIRKLGNGSKNRRTSWARKMAKSIAPLKVRFMSNFVDQLTPLVILAFCIQQAAGLLMASESYLVV